MGHDLSRIVDTLYPLPKHKRLAALGALLKDKNLCKSLTKGAKEANLSLILKHTPAKAKSTHLTSLQPSCTVNSTVLEDWSKDLSKFWGTAQFQLEPGEGQFATFYDDTMQLQTRHAFDAIRLRFRKLFYYDLLCSINPRACTKTARKVYDQLAKIAARGSRIDPKADVVRSNIEAWVRAGRRYNKLTTTFGDAILFVLPDSFSIDYLEKRLPLDDEAYKTAVQPLEHLRGHLEELSGAEEVARKLRQITLEPFRLLAMEISVLTDGGGLPPDHVFIRRGHNIAGLLGPYEDQDPAISGDARITDVESEPEFPLVSGDYSLEYYNDPCLLDEAHTLEYYLNVRSPGRPCQSPVAQPERIPQHTNASSPSP